MEEAVARHIFRQLLSGVDYLHRKGVVHRDIKPANIVLTSESKYCGAKLIDFGLSCYADDPSRMKKTVGTIKYMAPEMLYNYVFRNTAKLYTELVDEWGLGVCLFSALIGCLPFNYNNNVNQYRDTVLKYRINSHSKRYKSLSTHCKRMIDFLLEIDSLRRPTCYTLLQSEWFKSGKSFEDE